MTPPPQSPIKAAVPAAVPSTPAPAPAPVTVAEGNFHHKFDIIASFKDYCTLAVSALPAGPPSGKKVGIALAEGVGSDIILGAILKSFASGGIVDPVVCRAHDFLMLPFVSQQLLAATDAVIAVAVITNDNIGSGSVSQALINGLLHAGVVASKPIVPGILIDLHTTFTNPISNLICCFIFCSNFKSIKFARSESYSVNICNEVDKVN